MTDYKDTFASDIDFLQQAYSRFSVSRIASSDSSVILQQMVPAELPDRFAVEILFYSLSDERFIYSLTLDNFSDQILSVKTVQYDDDSYRRFVYLDLSDYISSFPLGDYRAIFNFFVPEVGNAYEPILELSNISTSGREVELQVQQRYLNSETEAVVRDFAAPYITEEYVLDALAQSFGQKTSPIPSDNTVTHVGTLEFPDTLLPAVQDEMISASMSILTAAHSASRATVISDIQSGKRIFTITYLDSVVSQSIAFSYADYVSRQNQLTTLSKIELI